MFGDEEGGGAVGSAAVGEEGVAEGEFAEHGDGWVEAEGWGSWSDVIFGVGWERGLGAYFLELHI